MIKLAQTKSNTLKAYIILLYIAGSHILSEPEEYCIRDLANKNIFKKMPIVSNNPNYALACTFLYSINSDNVPNIDDLLADYYKLFSSNASAYAPPFESAYSNKIADNEAIISSIQHTYQNYGWQPKSLPAKQAGNQKLRKDHLGFELQFLNLMLEKFNEIEDGVCSAELSNDIKIFIDKHLKPWLSTWNSLVQNHSTSNFYRGVGFLTVACIQDVYNLV